MTTPNIYPIKFFAYDNGHYIENNKLAMDLWMRDRKNVAPNITWYGLDLEIVSPAAVLIHVREIADSLSGGIGKVVFTYQPTLTDDDKAILRSLIFAEQLKYAERELDRQEALERLARVAAIQKQLFGDVP